MKGRLHTDRHTDRQTRKSKNIISASDHSVLVSGYNNFHRELFAVRCHLANENERTALWALQWQSD